MQIWAESGKSALPICNYSQILYQFLTFTQNLKRSPDGKRYNTSYYNLDAIIAVGYRVNSKKATMFRIWANRVLKEFIIKGYVIKSLNLLLFPSVLPIILASSI